MDGHTVWVDAARCTGCGACVEACPNQDIVLSGGQARVDEAACTGCGDCLDVCPEGAIQPVVQGEIVPAPEHRVARTQHPGPLTHVTGTAVAVAGAGLLMKAAGALVRAIGPRLMRRSVATGRASRREAPPTGGDRPGAGRRHRRRGR